MIKLEGSWCSPRRCQKQVDKPKGTWWTTAISAPDWRTFNGGTRKRAALWLHHEVGVGGVFTKRELRDAFPGVEQIDRRVRDLRDDGWVISTSQSDPSLRVDELRLVEAGGSVWEPNYESRKRKAITNQERVVAMRSDHYMCFECGIAAGEAFHDDPLRMARLSVVDRAGGEGPTRRLSTICDRCHAGAGDEEPGDLLAEDLLAEIGELSHEQRDRLTEWIRRGSRANPKETELWVRYRRLPATERVVVEQHLEVETTRSGKDGEV